MSHYLARLVQRAHGTAPRVEPLLASRFAPSGPTEVAESDGLREVQFPLHSISDVVSKRESFSTEPSAARSKGEEEATLLPPLDTPELPLPNSAPDRAYGAEESEVAGSTVRFESGPGPFRPHGRKSLPSRRSATPENETDSSETIVRVTIGRIDVRAATEPLPRRKAPRPKDPKLSLDEYLKTRWEGGP